ncbi:MocR-like pyridoxine biosynthesis transcription factor PdxR [Pandoraea norimbergensis]|uniref:2-aminoadipate aminotransferase n=1 Tax=Pandoraea norimbergensis TaxID=93219 RepID=A0ABN4JJ01_9BURK|nr:PLP-dependent aminotransferase family protein [Pandoraea norimbergensis]ALS60447.1 2-aminoadipate aminotransferase [Pandoraea norimbergensis]
MSSRISAAMWNQLFLVSARAGMSLQSQIRQMLVSAILDERLMRGAAVPSSRELAEGLGVARNTVVLAYQQLVDEGYLIARERRGYFVNGDILAPRVGTQSAESREAASASARNAAGSAGDTPAGAAAGTIAPLDPLTPDWEGRYVVRPSGQRNIVKPIDWQQYQYPFIYGQFDPTMFPTADWRECCQKALTIMEIRDWAPDMIARDDETLIQQIRTRVLPRRGVWADADEIVLTNGAQQALYLLADLLVGARTTVGIEDPGYPDARNIFAIRTPKLIGLPVDEFGVPVDDNLSQCDYVYVTPSHQCPTTTTMPLAHREALLRRAETEDFVLIEDDYESENSYSDIPIPALKSLDRSDRVIYIGSLSKSFAPGLRLGYIVAPAALVAELRALRRLMIRHPSAFIQRSFSMFLALGHHDALLRRLADTYAKRAEVLTAALSAHMPEATFVRVKGGASCWVRGPEGLNANLLALRAKARGILIEPGDVFFMGDAPPRNMFRLGFSSIRSEHIEAGVIALAQVMRETMAESA